jgi:hypothetical protein
LPVPPFRPLPFGPPASCPDAAAKRRDDHLVRGLANAAREWRIVSKSAIELVFIVCSHRRGATRKYPVRGRGEIGVGDLRPQIKMIQI